MLWSRQGVKEACNCRSSKKEMTCVTFIGYWITRTPVWTLMCSLQSTKLTLLLLGGHRALPPRLLSPLSNGIRFIRSPQRLKLETTRRASDSSVFETGYQSPRRRVRGLQSPRKAFGNGLSTVAWCPRPLLPSAWMLGEALSWALLLWGESTGAGEGLAQPVGTRRRSKPTCPRARKPVTHCSVEMCVAETAFEDRHFFGVGGGCLVYLTGMRFHWPHYWSCSQERAGLSWLFTFFSLPPVASPFCVLFKLEIGKNLFFLRLSNPVLVVKRSQKQEA